VSHGLVGNCSEWTLLLFVLKKYISLVLFSASILPPIHCLSGRSNIYIFCNFQKLVPSKSNFVYWGSFAKMPFLWNGALSSGFRRQWQDCKMKYNDKTAKLNTLLFTIFLELQKLILAKYSSRIFAKWSMREN